MTHFFSRVALVALLGALLSACAPSAPAAPTTAPPKAAAPTAAPATQPAQPAQKEAQAQPAAAKPRTVRELANLPPGPDRQKILEDGAKQEGALMVYTTSTSLQDTLAAFAKKYSFVKPDLFSSRGEPLTQRTLLEAKAGRLAADVMRIDTAIYEDLKDVVMPFASPGAKFNLAPNAATGNYTGIGFTYSTERVAPGDVPKNVLDLLQPRWQRNVGLFAPPNNFPGRWVGALMEHLGDQQTRDFLRKLGDQQPYFYTQPEAAQNGLLAGEWDINMQGITNGVLSSRGGTPVGWVALDPTTLSPSLFGLTAAAPHPHAAMLFLDFVFSPEGIALSSQSEGAITADELAQHQKAGVPLPPRITIQKAADGPLLQGWMDLFDQLVVRK